MERAKSAQAPKSRCGFSSHGTDVVKVVAVPEDEAKWITEMLSFKPLLAGYTYKYLTARHDADLPSKALCEQVVKALLELIDAMYRGDPPPRRHAKVSDFINEANATNPAKLAAMYGGEADSRVQSVAYELKLLDSLFEAALAPYNRVHFSRAGGGPLGGGVGRGPIGAVQKYLYVSMQVLKACHRRPSATCFIYPAPAPSVFFVLLLLLLLLQL